MDKSTEGKKTFYSLNCIDLSMSVITRSRGQQTSQRSPSIRIFQLSTVFLEPPSVTSILHLSKRSSGDLVLRRYGTSRNV